MIDLHIHTVLSGDSDLTYERLKEIFPDGGVGIVEHSDDYRTSGFYLENIKRIPGFYSGIEADYIPYKNRLSVPDGLKFDYVLASSHILSNIWVYYQMPKKFFDFKVGIFGMDKILETALKDHINMTFLKPDIIAHPFFVLWLQGVAIPEKRMIEFFEKRDDGPAIEVNSKALSNTPPEVLPNILEFYELAKKNDSLFSYGSDAHDESQLKMSPICKKVMKRLAISEDDLFSL